MWCGRGELEYSCKVTFSIHVLAILALDTQMNGADVITGNVFSLGRIETAETHQFHHLRLVICLIQIMHNSRRFGNDRHRRLPRTGSDDENKDKISYN